MREPLSKPVFLQLMAAAALITGMAHAQNPAPDIHTIAIECDLTGVNVRNGEAGRLKFYEDDTLKSFDRSTYPGQSRPQIEGTPDKDNIFVFKQGSFAAARECSIYPAALDILAPAKRQNTVDLSAIAAELPAYYEPFPYTSERGRRFSAGPVDFGMENITGFAVGSQNIAVKEFETSLDFRRAIEGLLANGKTRAAEHPESKPFISSGLASLSSGQK